eukprot:427666-Pyramimonas_sp.AAC.1
MHQYFLVFISNDLILVQRLSMDRRRAPPQKLLPRPTQVITQSRGHPLGQRQPPGQACALLLVVPQP